MEQSPSEAMYI